MGNIMSIYWKKSCFPTTQLVPIKNAIFKAKPVLRRTAYLLLSH